MAFTRILVDKFLNFPKFVSPALTRCRISSSSIAAQSLPDVAAANPNPGDHGIIAGILPHQPGSRSEASFPEFRSAALMGETLLGMLRGMGTAKNNITFDGLLPPRSKDEELTIEDAKKVLKLSKLEMIKSELRQMKDNRISYSDFVQICVDGCGSKKLGLEFAKLLDESGNVIVLGDVVFLRPDQQEDL